jgi:hypothetical protein
MTWWLRGGALGLALIGLQGCGGSGGGNGNVACLPTATPDICITNEHGTYNGLGVHRFIRFNAAGSRSLTISARCVTGSNTDPDLVLYKNGQIVEFAESTNANQESMSVNVTAGDYVLEVTDYQFYFDVATSQSCFDINIAGLNTVGKTDANKVSEVVSKTSSAPIRQAITSTCNTTGQVTVSGTARYEHVPHAVNNSLDYSGITLQPVRGAVVEVMCGGGVYAEGVTDATGGYSLNAPNNQDFTVRVKAQMLQSGTPSWNFRVVDNTNAGALYSMSSSLLNTSTNLTVNLDADSGWGVNSYISTRVAAPFAILDSVYEAVQDVLAVNSSTVFPALDLNWSVNNVSVSGNKSLGQITTSNFDGAAIYILGAANDDIDEYDEHVIIHEWGHYFEHNFSRADNIGGPHGGGDVLDIRVAFGEGFGNAFSAMVTDVPQYSDANGVSQADGFGFNIESNACFNAGWYSECSVQSILYDLYDASNDGNDVVMLGFSPLYSVLVNQQKNTAAMTSIFSFIKTLKDDYAGNSTVISNINTLTSGQNIDAVADIYGDSQLIDAPGTVNQLPVYLQF